MDFSNFQRSTIGSAGYDLCTQEEIKLVPKKWTVIDTGLVLDGSEVVLGGRPTDILDRWWMMIAPRSGLGMEYGLRMHNTVGVIDQDYRGHIIAEVTVDKEYTLKKGEKFAQAIVMPLCTFDGEKEPTKVRGEGGFGSTGRTNEPTEIVIEPIEVKTDSIEFKTETVVIKTEKKEENDE